MSSGSLCLLLLLTFLFQLYVSPAGTLGDQTGPNARVLCVARNRTATVAFAHRRPNVVVVHLYKELVWPSLVMMTFSEDSDELTASL